MRAITNKLLARELSKRHYNGSTNLKIAFQRLNNR